ncbi:MAG: hypothetical protein B6I38_09505 [Anaerolineaceae bacterium 4572_5.1]|nr:MAG: hypothetical protein B6I38_09505 [Anaerolineaceae bacterium 4572_5.1]
MHLFYKINPNQILPTDPITEGADAGWGLALASKTRDVWDVFITEGILSLSRHMSSRAKPLTISENRVQLVQLYN